VSNGSVKKLEIPVDLGGSRFVVVSDVADTDRLCAAIPKAPTNSNALTLSSLPPVLLDIALPADYPFVSPPRIVSIHATYSWLPSIQRLHQQLADKWQPEKASCTSGWSGSGARSSCRPFGTYIG